MIRIARGGIKYRKLILPYEGVYFVGLVVKDKTCNSANFIIETGIFYIHEWQDVRSHIIPCGELIFCKIDYGS